MRAPAAPPLAARSCHAATPRNDTVFSHVKPADTPWRSDGLRDFFLYRDLGVAAATARPGHRAARQGQHGTGKGHRLAPP